MSWLRLPRLAGKADRFRRRTEQLEAAIGRLAGDLEQRLSAVAAELERARRELTVLTADLAERDAQLLARLERHRSETTEWRAGLSRDVHTLTHRLGELEQRLTVVQRAVGPGAVGPRALPPSTRDPGDDEPPRRSAADEGGGEGSDAFYAAFEDRFRGTRAEIRDRQRAHLPLLQRQDGRLGALPVIDLGCGRGEWLELLAEHGIKARGVDLNRVFLAENAARGLDVAEADALTHLRGCEAGSARAVTGFHVIEHLPFAVLQAVLDQALRVLAEGGLVLFETPNPENLIAAAHRFYYDPTHKNPIPPEAAAFLLQARGYRDVAIVRLHESRDPARDEVPGGFLRELLFGPQDYAVVGYR